MLVGIVRRQVVDHYRALFSEAGILVNSFTFSAAAVHAAIRLNGAAMREGFVALGRTADRRRRGLRRKPGAPGVLRRVQPAAAARRGARARRAAPAARHAGPHARTGSSQAGRQSGGKRSLPQRTTVRDGAGRGLSPAGAVGERAAAGAPPLQFPRDSHSDPGAGGPAAAARRRACSPGRRYADSKYLAGINAEIARVEPVATRAMALDRQIGKARAQTQLLDRFRAQTRLDLDALNELTRLIEPPAWTSVIDLSRETARITGEARDAAPLVKLLDSSPFFENSAPDFINRANNGGAGEMFQIHTSRENGK